MRCDLELVRLRDTPGYRAEIHDRIKSHRFDRCAPARRPRHRIRVLRRLARALTTLAQQRDRQGRRPLRRRRTALGQGRPDRRLDVWVLPSETFGLKHRGYDSNTAENFTGEFTKSGLKREAWHR